MSAEFDRQPTMLPPVLFVGAAALQQMMGESRKSTGKTLLAGDLALCASWFGLGSLSEFRKHQTTISPIEVEHASALVQSGPAAISRNPMYLGLLLALVANSFRRGRLITLIPAGMFMVALDRLQIPKEEAALTEKFGAEYESYRRKTPRWLSISLPWTR